MIELIDLKKTRRESSDLADLDALLKQLVGQPFLFFRVSYGDELRLHLGDLQGYSNPKMKGRTRGSYIVGARASSWIVSSAPRHFLLTSGDARAGQAETPATARSVDIKAIETGGFITPVSLVTSAGADRSAPGFSLQLRFSDGSTAYIRPMSGPDEAEPEIEEGSTNADEIEIADWEILTPHQRILKVGPGPLWSYLDSTRKHPE